MLHCIKQTKRTWNVLGSTNLEKSSQALFKVILFNLGCYKSKLKTMEICVKAATHYSSHFMKGRALQRAQMKNAKRRR